MNINIGISINLFKKPRDLLLFILFEKIVNEGCLGVDKSSLMKELSERSGLSLVLSEIEILEFLSCHEYGDDVYEIGSKYIEVFLSKATNMIWMRRNFRVYLVNRFYQFANI